ncbi:MAG: hypothetical protein HYV27_02315 [Candidatus Hydrogenedentes bacterium]|nr:hypothetical protein [Candidatus Hydrogenedentota bacterium]
MKFLGQIMLAALAMSCCFSCATVSGPYGAPARMSSAQVAQLADRILENTPEHVHWVEGTTFDWVLLGDGVVSNPVGLNEAVLARMEQRYTVYRSAAEIPEGLVEREADGQISAFKGGFRFDYGVTFLGRGRVKVAYADWEAFLAASSHWKVYRWNGAEWEIVDHSTLTVS